MSRTAVLIANCLLLAGCAHTPKLADTRNEEHYRAALCQLIPLGTPAQEALATLKEQGFDAGLNLNAPIWKIENNDVPEELGDSISGERVQNYNPLLPFHLPFCAQYRWRVVLILKDGFVERYRTYLSLSE